MFSDWSKALNNTQHLEKQRKCWVAQHLFSEKFDRDQTSLNKTQQGWTKLNKAVKRSEHFALNKCSVLFSEMFSTFDRGLTGMCSRWYNTLNKVILLNVNPALMHFDHTPCFSIPSFRFCNTSKTRNLEMENLAVCRTTLEKTPRLSSPSFQF